MNSNKHVVESKRTGSLVRSEGKQCYLNAFRVIQEVEEYADADYVEGGAVIGGVMVIEHGWVEKDGVIVDPTLPRDNLVYFAGLRFCGQRGIAEAMQTPKPSYSEHLPIFYRFGWGGVESPEFRAAMAGAYRYAGMENLAKLYDEWKPRCAREPAWS
jgi:hypothetical protein